MSVVVVDASLVFKWIVSEQYSETATAQLAEWSASGTRILAPSLMAFEITNALHKRVLRAELEDEEAELLLTGLLVSGPELDNDRAVHVRALEIARVFRRPSSYDSHYVALAEREGCECWTADERFYNAVSGSLPWVRCVGEVTSAPGDATSAPI